jgi:hypothetical protein
MGRRAWIVPGLRVTQSAPFASSVTIEQKRVREGEPPEGLAPAAGDERMEKRSAIHQDHSPPRHVHWIIPRDLTVCKKHVIPPSSRVFLQSDPASARSRPDRFPNTCNCNPSPWIAFAARQMKDRTVWCLTGSPTGWKRKARCGPGQPCSHRTSSDDCGGQSNPRRPSENNTEELIEVGLLLDPALARGGQARAGIDIVDPKQIPTVPGRSFPVPQGQQCHGFGLNHETHRQTGNRQELPRHCTDIGCCRFCTWNPVKSMH